MYKRQATADVDNAVTDADKGFGEQGRAKVELEIPAGVAGEQALEITTDAGTKVSLPVTVAEAEKPGPEEQGSSSDAPIGVIVGVIAAVLALVLPLALAFPIDSVLGPIALLNPNK